MNNKGFVLRPLLVIIGLSIVIIFTVFLIQKRDSRVASITEFYERYLQDKSIEGSEGILSDEMIATIEERGVVSVLCVDVVPDDTVISSVKESDGVIDVILSHLEEPIKLVIKEGDDRWKIARIECPSVDLEEETVIIEDEESVEEIQVIDIPSVSRAKKDLSVRLNVDVLNIDLVIAEAVIFSDSSLGVSAPGEVYSQKLTPGYFIILLVDGNEYQYHADETRAIFIP